MKKGDKVWIECEVLDVGSRFNGVFLHPIAYDHRGKRGIAFWGKPEQCRHTSPPDHSAYIGKTLADVPDGTVAVVWNSDALDVFACRDGDVYELDNAFGLIAPVVDAPEAWEVLHIIKLGKPKPVTLLEAAQGVTMSQAELMSLSDETQRCLQRLAEAIEREQQASA